MAPKESRASGSCGDLLAARSTNLHPIGSMRKTQGVWGLAPIAAGILTQMIQLTHGPTGLHSQPLSENAGSSLGLADVSSCPSLTLA